MWQKRKKPRTGGNVGGFDTSDGAGATGTDDGAEGISSNNAGGTGNNGSTVAGGTVDQATVPDEVLVPTAAMEVSAF